MKRTFWYQLTGVGLLSLGLAIAPMATPALSQEAPGTTDTEAVEVFGETVEFNWGWLGLLGLLGLAGLAGRGDRRASAGPNVYREPEVPAQGDPRSREYR